MSGNLTLESLPHLEPFLNARSLLFVNDFTKINLIKQGVILNKKRGGCQCREEDLGDPLKLPPPLWYKSSQTNPLGALFIPFTMTKVPWNSCEVVWFENVPESWMKDSLFTTDAWESIHLSPDLSPTQGTLHAINHLRFNLKEEWNISLWLPERNNPFSEVESLPPGLVPIQIRRRWVPGFSSGDSESTFRLYLCYDLSRSLRW